VPLSFFTQLEPHTPSLSSLTLSHPLIVVTMRFSTVAATLAFVGFVAASPALTAAPAKFTHTFITPDGTTTILTIKPDVYD
jgi:hypothetical protein